MDVEDFNKHVAADNNIFKCQVNLYSKIMKQIAPFSTQTILPNLTDLIGRLSKYLVITKTIIIIMILITYKVPFDLPHSAGIHNLTNANLHQDTCVCLEVSLIYLAMA